MRRDEEALHRDVVVTLRAALPSPWLVWHTPNGCGRSKAEAGILKAMGTLAGMPDLFVLGPGANLIAIELKAPPRRFQAGAAPRLAERLNPAQRALQRDLGACGVPYLVCDDVGQCLAGLRALGVPVRGRVM